MITLTFVAGTIEVHGLTDGMPVPEGCRWDARARCHRAAAADYAEIVRTLHREGIEYTDRARGYEELAVSPRARRTPRPYQEEALRAWLAGVSPSSRARGVVVLPTGAGKSHLAVMAIEAKQRSTLVIAPTLDLVRQWYDLLRTTFGGPIGLVGGGEHEVHPITVTTYDSAHLHMEHFGHRFGLVIFDECHHLPGESYALAARFTLAPFRLGLTATPERADGRETALEALIGPLLYRRDIVDLSGDYLADYDVVRIAIELTREERAAYEEARSVYRSFLARQGLRIAGPSGWQEFVRRSSRDEEGRRAMEAFRHQRQLAFAASGKFDYLELLLHEHRRDRTLIFTQDNATAYAISLRFLVPAITHHTKITERSSILEKLREGAYGAVVTSKVLNEGVDVPEANVAVVVSGSGSVREHVQRLGRVLRKSGEKRAILYELVTTNTGETFTSERRRDHVAYR